MKVLIPLAEGFEEIEAITVIDLLRRAGIEVVTAALKENPVKGAHNVKIEADIILDRNDQFDAIVLPGGIPGSTNLRDDPRIIRIIQRIRNSGGLTAAICAAPIVLSKAGILNDRKFTCYPGYEKDITEGEHSDEKVIIDGSVVTGKGAGCAPLFALAVIEHLKDKKTADAVKEKIEAFW